MKFKLNTTIDFFILFIIFIKIIFVISAITHVILSHSKNHKAQQIDPIVVYWKERTEFVFIVTMAILLVYHFNPRLPRPYINHETSILFFLYGLVLIFTAKWSLFISEAPWYKDYDSVLPETVSSMIETLL